MTETTGQPYSGKARVEFCLRLGDSWRYLAMCLEIPDSDSAGFEKGHEGRDILQWLQQRNRLDDLPSALDFIRRPELALGLRPLPVPAVETRRWEKDRSPYPGLAPFTAEYATVFFGRDRHTSLLLERLQTTRFIAVVGASGSGKSSLVATGLMPRLKDNALPGSRDWIVLEFTPGGPGKDPFVGLAYHLEPFLKPYGLTALTIDRKLRTRGGISELAGWVLARRDQAELLLFIDQFEELFTLCAEEHRPPFVSMLHEAAGTPRLRILITLRADFYAHCLRYGLAELLNAGLYSLSAPSVVDLYEMITRPAVLAGLHFEDQELPLEILNDTENEPGALALMAAALAELYEKRTPAGTLTRTAYEELGKVEGVIAKLADEAYEGLGAEAKDALGSVFWELVEIDERGVATRRRAALDQVRHTPAATELVDRFTDPKVRLLVTSEGENHQRLVEVAHEALLRSWPLLVKWIETIRDDRRLHRQLQLAVETWQEHKRHKSYLWSSERVLEVRAMLQRQPLDLTDDEWDFLGPLEPDRMLAELDEPATAHERRALIGVRLALIGDTPEGVGLRPDRLPDIVWCKVPGGEITLEVEEKQSSSVAPTFKVEPFYIAKYLVTYIQYQAFLEASDGYHNSVWWQGLLFQVSEPGRQFQQYDNHPAENACWLEVMAFCCWLSARLGYEIRLPTEWEWQQAATGGNPANVYPWGPDWDDGRVNTYESGLQRSTAVGM